MMQTPPAFPPFPAPPGLDLNVLISQVVAPLVAVVVVIVVGAIALRWLFRSPVGEALAERIREGSRRRRHWKGLGGERLDAPAEAAADDRRVAALEERGSALDGQGADIADRLQFPGGVVSQRRATQQGGGRTVSAMAIRGAPGVGFRA